jgi:hypothetical protein
VLLLLLLLFWGGSSSKQTNEQPNQPTNKQTQCLYRKISFNILQGLHDKTQDNKELRIDRIVVVVG